MHVRTGSGTHSYGTSGVTVIDMFDSRHFSSSFHHKQLYPRSGSSGDLAAMGFFSSRRPDEASAHSDKSVVNVIRSRFVRAMFQHFVTGSYLLICSMANMDARTMKTKATVRLLTQARRQRTHYRIQLPRR